jgi:hypothetical protein
MSADFTTSQLESMTLAYHRQELVACPRCEARIEPKAHFDSSGFGPDHVLFLCPGCQGYGRYTPPTAPSPWSDEQIRQIVLDDRRHGEARCPEDGAVLRVAPLGERERHYHCPFCGRRRRAAPELRAPG